MQYRSTLRQLNGGYLISGLVPGIATVLWSGARELSRGYGTSLSTVVTGLVFAEIGLFIAMFWALFATQWSTVLGASSVALQSPQSLVLVVTVDLSILGACVAAMTIRTQMGSMNTRAALIKNIIVPAGGFCWLLVMEYRALSIYINDNAQGSSLMLITGLHFSHVCFGVLLLAFSSPHPSTMVVPAVSGTTWQVKAVNRYEPSNVGTVLYMHFVELIWIGIHAGTYV